MMHVSYPLFLLLLPVPLALYIFIPRTKSTKQVALKVPFLEQLKQSVSSAGMRGLPKVSFLTYLMAIVWALVVVSGAGLQWVGEPKVVSQSGRDLMMAIDLSGSMSNTDMKRGNKRESRYDLVIRVANQFIQERQGDRVGLVLFGSRAYLQTPLTFDTKTVAAMLNDSFIGMAGQTTAIGDAIGLSIKKMMQENDQSKALILLTDGENNSGALAPLQAAEIAKKQGITIYTIALGGGSMTVNTRFGGQQKINTSQDLDTNTLAKIAKMTGGKYFRASNSTELANIYADIDKMEPIDLDKMTVRPVTYLYPWTLGPALLLSFLLAFVWLNRRRGY